MQFQQRDNLLIKLACCPFICRNVCHRIHFCVIACLSNRRSSSNNCIDFLMRHESSFRIRDVDCVNTSVQYSGSHAIQRDHLFDVGKCCLGDSHFLTTEEIVVVFEFVERFICEKRTGHSAVETDVRGVPCLSTTRAFSNGSLGRSLTTLKNGRNKNIFKACKLFRISPNYFSTTFFVGMLYYIRNRPTISSVIH